MNWKLIGVAAIVLGLAVAVYPPLLGLAPILLLAICPLSMFLMGGHAMHGMKSGQQSNGHAACHDDGEASESKRLSELERRLQAIDAEKAALSREVDVLKRVNAGEAAGTLREAEEVARRAEKHLSGQEHA